MHGVFNILKPPGMTSHDVVAVVRRATGIRRAGHSGTLDPLAAGVMVVCVGQATRLVEYLQEGTKEYTAEITFGHETDTLDAEGEVVASGDASHITLETLRAALDNFRGIITQVPPLYSAIKQGGRKLYELAREGAVDVEIPTREVTITKLWVSKFTPQSTLTAARAMLHIECSGGTYIRSLVRDIGRALNCPATMSFLVRTRNGVFGIDEAITLEEITDKPQTALLPMLEVLSWCCRLRIQDSVATHLLAQGRILNAEETACAVKAQYNRPRESGYANYQSRAMSNGIRDVHRALFVDEDQKVAVLAFPLRDTAPIEYKAEKVFHLDEA